MSEAEGERDTADVSGATKETDENPKVPNPDEAATESVTPTQSVLEEDDGIQTAVQQTQVDICSDQEIEPSSPSQTVGQDRVSPHEQERINAADVGNSTATGDELTVLYCTFPESKK